MGGHRVTVGRGGRGSAPAGRQPIEEIAPDIIDFFSSFRKNGPAATHSHRFERRRWRIGDTTSLGSTDRLVEPAGVVPENIGKGGQGSLGWHPLILLALQLATGMGRLSHASGPKALEVAVKKWAGILP